VVPFVFSGVVREFPTAPRDSFLVANADYVAKVTGTAAAEVVLMRTSLTPAVVKASVQDWVVGKGMQVSSIDDVVHIIGSSLSAVDLKGLSQIELTFAVMLGIGATALVLALGFADRRRDFAILKVLGSSRRALSSFVWAEAGFVVIAGAVSGALVGTVVAQILIKVLEGVFDPPPEAMSAPLTYLAVSLAAILAATALAAINAVNQALRDPLSRLREQQ
jgi:putative ABC transport system permease protein